MRHIDGVYTQRFNRSHERDGPLFRGRYKAILIQADGYLLEVLKYIHQNPMKAGLEKSFGAYPWSSHQGYLSKEKKWSWLAKEPILGLVTKAGKNRRKAYLDLMNESLVREAERFYSLKTLRSILGNAEFIQSVKDRFADALFDEEIPESAQLKISMDSVIKTVCDHYEMIEETLCTPQRGVPDEAKGMAVYLARKHTGESLRTIAERFGLKRHSSAGSLTMRFEANVTGNSTLKRRLKAVEKIVLRQEST